MALSGKRLPRPVSSWRLNHFSLIFFERHLSNCSRPILTVFNPDCAVGIYCGLKIHAIPPRRDFTILVLDILMNMPAGQNRSNCAFRNGFLRLATMPTAQSGLNPEVGLHDLRLIFELTHFPFPSDLPLFKYIGPVGKLHDETGILF